MAAVALAGLLTGLPWALVHYVGWPLPDHPPSWTEIEGVLLGPMATTFLLDFLACLTWLLWVVFTADVARCAAGIARETRMPELSDAGPLHRAAAMLIGAIMISAFGLRAGIAFAPPVDSGHDAVAMRSVAHTAPLRSSSLNQPGSVQSAVVLPYDPETGVHDSLWRMAARKLGDGSRWPEIYELNKGKPQPGGGVFTRPSLIFPGEEMVLPGDATVSTNPVDPPRTPVRPPDAPPTPSSPATLATTTSEPETTQPSRDFEPTQTPSSGTDEPGGPAFSGGAELFVGLGVVTAVSAAVVAARRRNRRRYRPGSGDRSDLPIAPVVYRLRLAHLRAEGDDLHQSDRGPRRAVLPPTLIGATAHGKQVAVPVGVRDSREVVVDLAAARGLGLLGAGAPAAARALLIAALSLASVAASGRPRVVIPADDLSVLLDRRARRIPVPRCLYVVDDLDAALDALESETLVRASAARRAGQTWQPVVLVARASGRQARRLQAVVDNGSSLGLTVLLLGQWTSGVTLYVRDDGTVSTTSPGLGEQLRGTRVFRLGDDHATDLLTLLRQADPEDESEPDNRGPGSRPIADPVDPGTPPADDNAERNLEILGAPPAAPHRLRPRSVRPASVKAIEVDNQAPLAPLRISVLGPPRVWWAGGAATGADREVTSAFQPRLRELLVFLSLHPDGATREALVGALWAASAADKTTNAMNTSFSRLRRAVSAATDGTLTDIVLAGEGRFRMNPDLVQADYWLFAAAVDARRAAITDQDRVRAYRRIVDSYTGPLADGLSTEWMETAREAIRRDAIDAVAALARALVEAEPQQTLDLLEIARAFDPHNELIYRDIMRLQERLGQFDAIPRTLTLLTARLAEVDDRPTSQAVDLANRLGRYHDSAAGRQSKDRHGRSRTG